ALQAVSRGSTTLGLKTKDFALLSSQVKPTRPLMEPAEKVFVVDEHIGATGSGYIGDVTTLLDQLRVAAQRHRLVYDEPIDVGTLSRNLSEYLHEFTMYAVRPFGASVVIAGVDALGVQLIQVDPSGTTFKGSAFAIGQSADEALDTIVKGYRPDLNVEQAIALSAGDRGRQRGQDADRTRGRDLVLETLRAPARPEQRRVDHPALPSFLPAPSASPDTHHASGRARARSLHEPPSRVSCLPCTKESSRRTSL